MKVTCSVVLAVALSVCVFAPATPAQAQNEKQELEKLKATMKECVEAYSRADVEKAVGMYAEDAMYLIEGKEILKGRPAIREFLSGVAWSKAEFKQELVALRIEGDIAYEVVNQVVTVHTGDQVRTAPNKYIHLWKRQKDGSWKLLIDMVNSRPSPSQP